MPYVKPKAKAELDAGRKPVNVGELTYVIQQKLKEYIELEDTPSYQSLAECLGALEGAKLDLYVRKIEHYEIVKMLENGDVWD